VLKFGRYRPDASRDIKGRKKFSRILYRPESVSGWWNSSTLGVIGVERAYRKLKYGRHRLFGKRRW